MPGDDIIELRLGEAGLIPLVMTVFPVRQQIDEHIDVELLPKLQGQLCHENHCLNIITIYVKHRRLRYLRHIGTIGAGTSLQIVGGKPHLIIDHDMDGAACFITSQLRKLNGLVNHTLTGDGSITMHLNGQHLTVIVPMFILQLSTRNTLHYRPYGLEMGRVGRQAHRKRTPFVIDGIVVPEMVFHIAVFDFLVVILGAKLTKDLRIGLFHDIGEHIQSPPVGHSNHNLVHTIVTAVHNNGIQRGND